ncbi:MAG TPA: PQQ-binding-like beta-propeller repeat protein [Vicinamibacterales bacterium]|nr:PQQ-binding-like beta-propeller repeat protein [Vicinamibacterales bacterium]
MTSGEFLSLGINWSARLDSPIAAPPIVDGERAYIPLQAGRIVALALATGRERWTIDVAARHALATDEGRLFAATETDLVAIGAASGRLEWRRAVRSVTAPPVAKAGWVVVGSGQDLLAIRGRDGQVIWQTPLTASIAGAPAIDGDRVYVPLDDASVAAVEITTGAIVWRTRLPAVAGRLTVAGDRVFAGCEDNFFYAVDARDGDRDWRWRTGADVIAPAAHDGERVYFASLDNVIRALDFGSGVQRWRHPMEMRPLAGPAIEGELLLVSAGREVRAIGRRDGSLTGRWTAPAELAGPAALVAARTAMETRMVVVTGAATGGWRVYGLAPQAEPPPRPLTEIPGRPLSPGAPPAPPLSQRPGA